MTSLRSPGVDVAALDIRIAVPDDALGARRRPPGSASSPTATGRPTAGSRRRARSRSARSASGCGTRTTWCAMALEPDGEPAGHVGITHAAERERPHVRIPGRAHLWMLFVRPPWWGTGLAARLHALGLEEAARQGYETIRLYTPAAPGSRARLLRARGLDARRARRSPSRCSASTSSSTGASCDLRPLLEEATERSRVSMRTRWERVRLALADDGAGGGRGRARVGGREVACWGHTAPFFAPVVGDHRARHRATTSAGGGRSSSWSRSRSGSRSPTCSLSRSGTGVRPARARRCSSRIGLGLFFGTSQLFVNQVAISAVLVVHDPAAEQRDLVRARGRRADRRRRSRWPSPRSCCPATRCGCCATRRGRCWTSWRRRCATIAAALRARDVAGRRGRAGARARRSTTSATSFFAAAREGRETARYSPARRRARGTVEFYAEAAARIDLAVRNVRVLARGAMRALSLDENVPPEVADAIEDLARRRARAGATRWTTTARLRRRSASPPCAPRRRRRTVLERTDNLSVSVIVGQIRSTAIDLLAGTGMDERRGDRGRPSRDPRGNRGGRAGVLAGMPPAARIGDNHTCPMVDPGPKPHVGGPVVSGAPNVLINGRPPPGSATPARAWGRRTPSRAARLDVFIAGAPAARLGDGTAHGGMVAAGSANVIVN